MNINKQLSRLIYSVNHEDFQRLVLDASHAQPVLVDLWADWCAPCVVIAPVLERLVDGYAGRLHLAKVEADEGENMKIAGHYRVRGFPTIILFEQGEERGRFHGARPARFIEAFIKEHSRML